METRQCLWVCEIVEAYRTGQVILPDLTPQAQHRWCCHRHLEQNVFCIKPESVKFSASLAGNKTED